MENDQSITKKLLEDDDDSLSQDEFKVIVKERKFQELSIYLSESIMGNFAYVDLLHTLRSAKSNDTVKLYLANYGGSASTGFQIINAMKECKPGVDVIVDGACYSAGALIAIGGKSLVMNPGTFLMFHAYTSMELGKALEVRDAVNHYYDFFVRYMPAIASPFLTPLELTSLVTESTNCLPFVILTGI